MDRLSGPAQRLPSKLDLKLDPTLRHTTYSDAQNCRFRPITVAGIKRRKQAAQQSNDSNNDNRKEDSKFSFINRQEADERTRRAELEFQMGKKDYDAIVDKKMCPKCGAKKSYDEVIAVYPISFSFIEIVAVVVIYSDFFFFTYDNNKGEREEETLSEL